jgi:hypothetical protein
MPEHHTEEEHGNRDMKCYEELVHSVAKWSDRVQAKESKWHEGSNSGTVGVKSSLRKEAFEDMTSSFLPYGCDVEWNGVDDAQYQADIGGPSMKNVESLMSDTGDHGDEVRLH